LRHHQEEEIRERGELARSLIPDSAVVK
jgi:hypothetical protein